MSATVKTRISNGNLPRWIRRVLVALAAAGTLGALAVPSAASAATTTRASSAIVSYGEHATFQCSTGQVQFDILQSPYTTLTTVYIPVVYRLTTSGWAFYAYMYNAYGNYYGSFSSPSQENAQRPFTANVAPGYYYRVEVTVATTGHITHVDHAHLAIGPGAGGYVCTA